MKAIKFGFTLVFLAFFDVAAADQLTILHSPDSVRLSKAKEVALSDISALPYHLFGIDERQSGLIADVSFLRRPKLLMVATVACGGGCSLALPNGGRELNVRENSDLLVFGESSLQRALRRRSLPKSVVVRTSDVGSSASAGLFADARESPLPNEASLPSGWESLIAELRRADAVAQKLINSKLLNDSQPDVLHVEINSLAGRSVPDDVQKFVADFLRRLAIQLDAAVGNRAFVVMATVANEAPLARLGRSLMETEDPGSNSMNLAADYDEDFPIMFNLILWLCVVLALAVYAVGYSLWNIDPGKDSIIYRRGYAHAKVD